MQPFLQNFNTSYNPYRHHSSHHLWSFVLQYAAPTIEIKVEGENHFNQHMQSVALAPEMSTYDAMNAARNMYAYTNVNSLHNPYM